MALEKEHLDQERSNFQSTKLPQNDIEEDYFPPTEVKKTYQVFAVFERTDEKKFQPKEKTYSDQTGKFLHMSTRGNQYVFTMYDYDANAILLEPLKSKQSKEIAEVFTTCHNRLTLHRHKITIIMY